MVAGGIMNDKEKLRHQLIMAKSLVKSNNKKIKEIKEIISKLDVPYDHAQMANAIQKIDIILGKNN
mgnify:FL=1